MTKSVALILILLALAAVAVAQVVITEDFESPPYFWTPYNDGILAGTTVGGIMANSHGWFADSPRPSYGDWIPDPTAGIWTGIQGTPSQWIPSTQALLSAIDQNTGLPFTYNYILSNPANPYERTANLYGYVTGYPGDFWNSYNTCWYAGDINGGYLISDEAVNLSGGGTLAISILKLGVGSAYLYVDWSTSQTGPWTQLGSTHNISHSASIWVPYSTSLESLGADGVAVYLRLRFRANCSTGWQDAPFSPQANIWMDDFQLTLEPPTPVELSSFTAVLTQQYFVNLTWVTQSETNVNGYYVYRANAGDFASAEIISPMIGATNTSTTQTYIFTDYGLNDDGTYYYWLQGVDFDGSTYEHGPVFIYYSNSINTPPPPVPTFTELKAIYPNPFNPTAFIPYTIATTSNVGIRIYNSRGQIVRDFDLGSKTPGSYRMTWDGRDYQGSILANGVYHIIMTAGNETFARKALLLK